MKYLLLLFLVASCAWTTIEDLPRIKHDDIVVPPFRRLTDKTIYIRVNDGRDLYQAKSLEIAKEVEKVLDITFAKAGFEEQENPKSKLTVEIKEAKSPQTEKYNPSCVKLLAKFEVSSSLTIDAESVGCYEYTAFGGKQFGSDISRAYQSAIQTLLNILNKKTEKLL